MQQGTGGELVKSHKYELWIGEVGIDAVGIDAVGIILEVGIDAVGINGE